MTRASGALPPGLSFRPASEEDATTISALAREIWTAVYPDLIGRDQIDFMLDLMYAPDTLRSEISEHGVAYYFIDLHRQPSGYLAFSHHGTTAHLHKLYLKPALHRRGFGSAALSWLARTCHATGASSLQLRVNKANSPAIRAYEKNGFLRTSSLRQDIGGGFVMDDYIYSRPLP